jgi:hypothetical protein
LKRGSRRASLGQFWTTQNSTVLGVTTVGDAPQLPKSDGADIWVPNAGVATVSRVRASDGKVLETWTGATLARGVLVAMGYIFVSGSSNPGHLYRIDPAQTAGAVTTVAINLAGNSWGIAFDGARVWTANNDGSVSIVTPGVSIPWTVTNVAVGNYLLGALYDGANVWVMDNSLGKLFKLDAAGAVLQTVTVGGHPVLPAFDGTMIWVPTSFDSVSVVRASSGAVVSTLTGNGLVSPQAAAFDGQRVLVTNFLGDSVSLWKAADLTPLGSVPTGNNTGPAGVCSDGINFWISLQKVSKIARF